MLLPTTQLRIPAGTIDLGAGDPQFELLPLKLLQRAAAQRFSQDDPYFLQYGFESGDSYLRQALAGFLSQEYGFPVNMEELFITNGASMGLHLICTLFTRPGDVIFVEEPSYFLALRIFADHGLRAVAVPIDEHGLVVEALEENLKKERPVLVYTIPTYQNPSGCSLSQARRERLVALSQAYNFLIVADEVYHLLHYTGQPARALAGYVAQANVVSLGSFSKILAPGLRLGWIQTHRERIARLSGCGLLDSGGGMNPFTSAIVRGLLEGETPELAGHIEKLRKIYQARLLSMDQGLRRNLPEAHYTVPQGGYFFWVRLPEACPAEALLPHAALQQVGFRPGRRFSSQNGLEAYIRLCFAFYPSEQIEEGLVRLGRAVQEV